VTLKDIKPHPSWNPIGKKLSRDIAKNRVNSLLKGLRVLEVLNSYPGQNSNALAKLTGNSRGSTYRILETLRSAGYVKRDIKSGTYWLEPSVLGLTASEGHEAWIWKVAKPVMEQFGKSLVWPMTLLTQHGVSMMVRMATDPDSPVIAHKMAIGARMPILTTAGGLAYLAFCETEQRRLLVELSQKSLARSSYPEGARGALLHNQLKSIKSKGYCIHDGGHGVTVIAVPVFSKARVFASLGLRFFSSAMSFKIGIERFLKPMQMAAQEIGLGFDSLKD